MIPPLEPHCNSWIVYRLSDGAAILETWQAAVVRKVNRRAYGVMSAAQWLARINQEIAGA